MPDRTLAYAHIVTEDRPRGVELDAADQARLNQCIDEISVSTPMVEVYSTAIGLLFASGWDFQEIMKFLYSDLDRGRDGNFGKSLQAAINGSATEVFDVLEMNDGEEDLVSTGHEEVFLQRIAMLQPNATVYNLIYEMLVDGIRVYGDVNKLLGDRPDYKLNPLLDDSGLKISKDAFLAWINSDKIFGAIMSRFKQLLLVSGAHKFNQFLASDPKHYISAQFLRYGCLNRPTNGGADQSPNFDLDERSILLIMDQVIGAVTFQEFCTIIRHLVQNSPENAISNQTFGDVLSALEGFDSRKMRDWDIVRIESSFRRYWDYVTSLFTERETMRNRLLDGSLHQLDADQLKIIFADESRMPLICLATGKCCRPEEVVNVPGIGVVDAAIYRLVEAVVRERKTGTVVDVLRVMTNA